MEMVMDNAVKDIFGDIDFLDEQLTKKIYKNLAKKYHPDSKNGDDEKIRNLTIAYTEIKKFQAEQKQIITDNALRKTKFEASLRQVEKDFKENEAVLKQVLSERKKINRIISFIEKGLKRNVLYFVFGNKNLIKKVKNALIIFLGFEFLTLRILSSFDLLLGDLILANVSCIFVFTAIFCTMLKNMNSSKDDLTEYMSEKNKLDKKVSKIKNNMLSLEIAKYVLLSELSNLQV